MELFLHTPTSVVGALSAQYKKAFGDATELFIVTAYLTEWDSSLQLNNNCKSFRIIIGKDFGITKKAACEKVMQWLPSNRKSQFMVVDAISGFHPKAVFWKDSLGLCHSIIGSSNLTKAAFESNYEVNIYTQISESDYVQAKNWVKEIEKYSLVVSEDWLLKYQEQKPKAQKNKSSTSSSLYQSLISLSLPMPENAKKALKDRRNKLALYEKIKKDLYQLFRDCANGKIDSTKFYDRLLLLWNWDTGRLQGRGWERSGRNSDFELLSKSFVKILDASAIDRDDIVVQEIDHLSNNHVSTRKAFLSEMLCLAYPDDYPLLNKPVHRYLINIEFSAPKNASEGSSYLDLAKKLRSSLLQNPDYPAKNLAELDALIWLHYN
jgi:HKD family nuclease